MYSGQPDPGRRATLDAGGPKTSAYRPHEAAAFDDTAPRSRRDAIRSTLAWAARVILVWQLIGPVVSNFTQSPTLMVAAVEAVAMVAVGLGLLPRLACLMLLVTAVVAALTGATVGANPLVLGSAVAIVLLGTADGSVWDPSPAKVGHWFAERRRAD
jgi:hypothetical protein